MAALGWLPNLGLAGSGAGAAAFKSAWARNSNGLIWNKRMKKNVASQSIGIQMVSATDGAAFTGTTTVYVTGDAGTQAIGSVGSGICTHEGNGFHTYAPAQAETNYDHIGFTFIGTGAVPATIQLFTDFPQTGDSYARIGAPAGASVSADIAAVKVDTAAILIDTAEIGTAGAGLTNITINAASVDAIWDESLAAHQTAVTTGRALTLAGTPLAETTASGVPTTTTLPLTAGSAVDNFYNDLEILPVSGSLAGQARVITGYTGATKTITVDEAWTSALSAGDAVIIRPSHKHSKSQIQALILSDATPFAGANIAAILDDTGTSGVVVAAGSKTGYSLTATTGLGNQTADITGNLSGSVGSVTGNVGGNVVGSVASVTAGVSVANGGIATTSFAAGAIDAASISADAGAEIADAILLRKLDRTGTGTDVAQERTVVNALRAIRNKVSVAAGTATITKEDDLTTAWTSAIGTTAGDPISSSDPT